MIFYVNFIIMLEYTQKIIEKRGSIECVEQFLNNSESPFKIKTWIAGTVFMNNINGFTDVVTCDDDIDYEDTLITINDMFVPITVQELYYFIDLTEVAALCSFKMFKYLYDKGYITHDTDVNALYVDAILGVNINVMNFLETHFSINVKDNAKIAISHLMLELSLMTLLPECSNLIQPHMLSMCSLIFDKLKLKLKWEN